MTNFESEYLRSPNTYVLESIQRQFSRVGFPGCIGCIDCAGWARKNCPKALQVIMCGRDKTPTLRMEVFCDLNLRVWHLFCGPLGVSNDINILAASLFLNAMLLGKFPPCDVRYAIAGQSFNW